MSAYQGVIKSVTPDEFKIQLVGGNLVTCPYDERYAHMKRYDTIWVHVYNGEVVELHTNECLCTKQALKPTPIVTEPSMEQDDLLLELTQDAE